MASRQRDGGGIAEAVTMVLTCGVLVTDGRHVLIGHATRSPRWDIPKGRAEAGENPETAARRELAEETGLTAPPDVTPLGRFAYLPSKQLVLFGWQVTAMPDIATLVCRSTFLVGGKPYPEFDRFACITWEDALPKLGKSMRAVLTPLAEAKGWLAP